MATDEVHEVLLRHVQWHVAQKQLVHLEAVLPGRDHVVLLLRPEDVHGLPADPLAVSFCHCLRGVAVAGEAHKAEAAALSRQDIAHHDRGRDGAKGSKEAVQLIVVDGVVEVAHEQV